MNNVLKPSSKSTIEGIIIVISAILIGFIMSYLRTIPGILYLQQLAFSAFVTYWLSVVLRRYIGSATLVIIVSIIANYSIAVSFDHLGPGQVFYRFTGISSKIGGPSILVGSILGYAIWKHI
ncbi:hypothetical protein MFMK1_003613 [Metallumcola ferriviriculae]|uniref:Uncharacterized protein n=1 Tax=Metallumcola ferriviriculae TaxID=3039180 RepID=A0AAU0UWN6_9FIRM|nr:hypothetical protein MFMK1_003613 [Desulfitibacteraceae bacterium MK1]